MQASEHPLQPERLEALEGYDILDSYQEQDFDEIVKLAARICEVPISLISLVEKDRQWFKAKVGLDLAETPISQSICAHAILQQDFFEIGDTTEDPRTADNSLVTGPDHIRFYAGARLVASNGLPIGTLCVLDTKPRHLTALQRDTLEVLARQVMKQLELRLALRNHEVLQSEMDHRVKNSLQATSSLIRVYGRTIKDPDATEAMNAIQRRIDAMSTLHGLLQGAARLAKVEMSDYLSGVVDLLRASAPPNVSLIWTSDSISLDSEVATSIGVIVSEFVANSLKHGFPDDRIGKVSIRLTRQAQGYLVLDLQDNGIGTRRSAEASSDSSGIGYSIMSAAASNIGGVLTNELTENGGHLTLMFNQTDQAALPA